jgi:putative salt-induced outer membrane protein YdiY
MLIALACWPTLPAQATDEPGLLVTGDLGFVFTGGNAEASSLAFKADLKRTWARSSFKFALAGLSTETSTVSRTAVGSPTSFVLDERSVRAKTAESFAASARLDRQVGTKLFVNGGVGWDRDRFAGIRARTYASGGLGYVVIADKRRDFRLLGALTYTKQDAVVEDPSVSDSFAGARLGWELKASGERTTFTHSLVLDQNLQDADDRRADVQASLGVALSQTLALKTGVRVLYDHLPSLALVDLRSSAGTPTGMQVAVPLDTTDTQFTVALVVKFERKHATQP